MAFSWRGFGTTFYGHKDAGEDGSYVTTEWFVIMYLPIIPVRSLRVLPQRPSTNLLVYRSQRYLSKEMPLDRRQVRNGYVVTGLVALAIALGFIFTR
jgi:hypothetical protein